MDEKTAKALESLHIAQNAIAEALEPLSAKMAALADAGQDFVDAYHLEATRALHRCGMISDDHPQMSLVRLLGSMRDRLDAADRRACKAEAQVCKMRAELEDAKATSARLETDASLLRSANEGLKRRLEAAVRRASQFDGSLVVSRAESAELRRILAGVKDERDDALKLASAAELELAMLRTQVAQQSNDDVILIDDVRGHVKLIDCAASIDPIVEHGGVGRVLVWTDYPRAVRDGLRSSGFDAEIDASPDPDGPGELTFVVVRRKRDEDE